MPRSTYRPNLTCPRLSRPNVIPNSRSRSCPPQDRCVRRLAQSWPNNACQIRARVAWLMPSVRYPRFDVTFLGVIFSPHRARSTFKVRPKPQAPLPLSPCSLSDRARPPHAPRAPTQPFAPATKLARVPLHPARPRPGGSPRRPFPAEPEEIGGQHPAQEMHAGKKLPIHTLTFCQVFSGVAERRMPMAPWRRR